jgi:hypothetical protein
MRPRNAAWSAFMPLNGSLPGLWILTESHVSFPRDFPCTASTAMKEDQDGSTKLSGSSSFLSSKVQTANNTARSKYS